MKRMRFYLPILLVWISFTRAADMEPLPDGALYPPGLDLPDDANRELVLRACTRCHDLKGLSAFKGYWNRERWLAMVKIMAGHGAVLDEQEQGRVADYLAEHFGIEKKV